MLGGLSKWKCRAAVVDGFSFSNGVEDIRGFVSRLSDGDRVLWNPHGIFGLTFMRLWRLVVLELFWLTFEDEGYCLSQN